MWWSILAGCASPTETSAVFEVRQVHVRAEFAVDWNGDVAAATRAGTLVEPEIRVLLGLEHWTGDVAQEQDYCTVVLPLASGDVRPAWVIDDDQLFWGVDHDQQTGRHDCEDLDPIYWGDDVVDTLLDPDDTEGWGVAIGRLDDDLDLPGGPGALGGMFRMVDWLAAEERRVVGAAYEIDQDLQVVDETPLPSGSIDGAWGEARPALYVVEVTEPFDF